MDFLQTTGCITNIQRYCLEDGPGIRTTVFLKGCPLRCLWCHNPETHSALPQCLQRTERCTGCGKCLPVCKNAARKWDEQGKLQILREKCTGCGSCAEACPTHAAERCGREVTAEAVISQVCRDRRFYRSSGGGMTVSGGECAMQPEFTLALLRGAAMEQISAAVETCGYGSGEFFREAASLNTLFLYDLKLLDSDKHKTFTGVDNARILENLEMLMALGAKIILRLPLIPGVNDSDRELEALAGFLKDHRGKYLSAQLMPYHDLGTGKALALGQIPFAVDPALSANRCAPCRKRWLGFFTGLDVECAD